MVRTPNGTWPALKTFGVFDLLAASAGRKDLLLRAKEAVNDALQAMGVFAYSLKHIEYLRGDGDGHKFLLKFDGAGDRAKEEATIAMTF